MRELRRIRLVDNGAEGFSGTPENSVRRRLMICEEPWSGPDGAGVRVEAAGHEIGKVCRRVDGSHIAWPSLGDPKRHAEIRAGESRSGKA